MPTDELIGTIDPFNHPIPRLSSLAAISTGSARGCHHQDGNK